MLFIYQVFHLQSLFLPAPIDTWDFYYFESILSLLCCSKKCCLYEKRVTLFFLYYSKHDKITLPHKPIFVLTCILLEQYCVKKLKGVSWEKAIKGIGHKGEFSIEAVVKPSAHYDLSWWGRKSVGAAR